MDPNETLLRIRATAEAMQSDECHAEQRAILAGDLVELVQALDVWLTRGGFLPDAWKPELRASLLGERPVAVVRQAHVEQLARAEKAQTIDPLGGPHPGVNGHVLPEHDDWWLCDGCYGRATGLFAQCQDGCALPLDHDGACHPRDHADVHCQACGQTDRLTRVSDPASASLAGRCDTCGAPCDSNTGNCLKDDKHLTAIDPTERTNP